MTGRSAPEDLLDFLRARLPLRTSGKLDRDALPSPRPVSPTPGGAVLAAEMMAWTSTLPTGQAEADDDFGATGFLGAHLLRELLDRTDARIDALARERDEAQRRDGIHRPPPEPRTGRPHQTRTRHA